MWRLLLFFYFHVFASMLFFLFRKHVGWAGEDLQESWQQKTLVWYFNTQTHSITSRAPVLFSPDRSRSQKQNLSRCIRDHWKAFRHSRIQPLLPADKLSCQRATLATVLLSDAVKVFLSEREAYVTSPSLCLPTCRRPLWLHRSPVLTLC